MKFHCDRCKTRYSIADDRVRGKVLKIRCKNCSAVITVREERGEPGEAAGVSGSIPAGESGQISAHAEPPWFFAVGGIQHGPMPLTDAMAWVAKRDPGERIFCWQEDFEDWRPVQHVEHFADLREPPAPEDEPNFEGDTVVAGRESAGGEGVQAGASETEAALLRAASAAGTVDSESPAAGAGDADAPAEPSPHGVASPAAEAAPDSAATASFAGEPVQGSGQVVSPEESPAEPADPAAAEGTRGAGGEGDGPASPSPSPSPGPGESMDFEFDEASRIVDLASIYAAAGAEGKPLANEHEEPAPRAPAPRLATAGDPAFAAGGSPVADSFSEPGEVSLRRTRRSSLSLIVSAAAVAGVAALGFALYALSGSGDDQPAEIIRSAVPDEHLGHRVDIEPVSTETESDPAQGDEADGTETAEAERGGADEGREAGAAGHTASASGGSDRSAAASPSGSEDRRGADSALVGGGEVDLGDGDGDGDSDAEPLTPDDLLETYRRHQILIDRCYSRALARDPRLDVTSAHVTVTIEPTGDVGNVSIPDLEGTDLGTCLQSRIGGWRFRESPERFTGEFRMMFDR